MKFQRNFLFLFIASFMLTTSLWVALAKDDINPASEKSTLVKDDNKELQQHIFAFLENPLFIELDLTRPSSWKLALPYIHFSDEKADHLEGVFRMRQMRAIVWSQTPINFGIYGESSLRLLVPEGTSAGRKKCQENALSLLKIVYPEFFKQGLLPIPDVEGPDRNGIWNFEWQRYRADELPDTLVHAQVRDMDGKIVSYGSSQLKGVWQHKTTPSQAKQKALQFAKSGDLADMMVVNWSIDGAEGIRYYEIRLKARDTRTGKVVYCGVSVNAMTGETEVDGEGWQPAENDQLPSFVVNDRLPVWTKQGLVFVSDRKLAKIPSWALVPSQLFLQNQLGNLHYLTSDLEEAATFSTISSLSNSSWIGMERHHWTYALDLESGSYRVLGNPERIGRLPTINSDGSWAIVTGIGRSGNPDYDLMPDNLKRDSMLGLRGRLVVSNSEEFYPTFSPDGQWLYFATSQEEEEGQWSHKLQRISAAVAMTKEIKRITPDQVQTIAILSEEVERLSIYPDGIQVLVQNRKGIFAVAIATGTVVKTDTQNVQDVEVGVPIKKITDGWAGPTNDRVTFSGETTDKNGKVRRRIYSCRFDGSDLKAHTPKDNTPVPMYKFPGSEKTAYDLAKEWALNEIKFDDERKANR